jgi:hypothetical protein
VFGLASALLKFRSQTKGPDPEKNFSKRRLSRGAKLKATLDLLLVAFIWNYENIYERIFSGSQ